MFNTVLITVSGIVVALIGLWGIIYTTKHGGSKVRTAEAGELQAIAAQIQHDLIAHAEALQARIDVLEKRIRDLDKELWDERHSKKRPR